METQQPCNVLTLEEIWNGVRIQLLYVLPMLLYVLPVEETATAVRVLD